MQGFFSEKSLHLYSELLSFETKLEYDFARCVRSDGSAYGTAGTCRKGTPEEMDPTEAKREIARLKRSIKDAEEAEEYQTKSGSHAYAKHWRERAQRDREALAKLQEMLPARGSVKSSALKNTAPSKTVKKTAEPSRTLNEREKEVLINYMTGGSMETGSMLETNWKLRGLSRDPLTTKEKEEVSLMDSALDKLPRNTRRVTMYRGIDLEEQDAAQLLKQIRRTGKITDKGFGSYSSDRDQAEMFATSTGGTSIVIVSRHENFRDAGKYAPEEFQDQKEHILPRNTTLTVREVKRDSDGIVFIYTDP